MRQAPVLIALLSTALTAGASQALTLQRMAAAVDLGKIASAVQLDQAFDPSDILLLEPLAANLTVATTEFRVRVPEETGVTIEVTDESGTCVCSARMTMPAGMQKVDFSGRGADGKLLPNGTYHYTVSGAGTTQSARVTINR